MKKYKTSLLILGVMFFASVLSLPQRVEAGITSTQSVYLNSLLQAWGVNASAITNVQNILSASTSTSSSSTGTTYSSLPLTVPSTSTSTSTNTGNGCSNPSYIYSITTGQLCPKTTSSSGTSGTGTSAGGGTGGSLYPTAAEQFSVKLSSPNGGEDYSLGEKVTVKWDTTGVSEDETKILMLLNFYDASGAFVTNIKLLSDFTENDGEEIVGMPSSLPTDPGVAWGNNFKVSVSVLSKTGVYLGMDYSDKNFTVE